MMGISSAFGAVNRKLQRATTYKRGIPLKATHQISQGRQNTTLRCKEMENYGHPIGENGGVFRGEALIAILIIIYLDGATQD